MSEEINHNVDRTLANMRPPFAPKEASWERLSTRIRVENLNAEKNYRPMWIGIAASIALAIGFFTIFSSPEIEIATGLAQHQSHTLPDGSVVLLNASSVLSYDEGSFAETRTLSLDGEAFFEVEKGSTFMVSTDQGNITVLGTSFNVCDRDDFFEVTCMTGKVAVSNGTEQITLSPGLATNNSSGQLSTAYNQSNTDGWREGEYAYEEARLDFVLEEIERQFGKNIVTPDLSERLFTGEFDSKDLETTLTVICEPMGLNYQIDEDTIMISIK